MFPSDVALRAYATIGLDNLAEVRLAVETWLIETVRLDRFQSVFPTREVLPKGLAAEAMA